MASASDVPEDLTSVSWEDKVWLQHFPLHRGSVLDYFAHSQFYDRTCNNEQVKMQHRERNLQHGELEQMLEKMTGVEYRLDVVDEVPQSASSTAHSLYVIRKQLRSGPPRRVADGEDQAAPVQTLYYVLDGVVYEVPSLHALLSSRVRKLGWLLDDAFAACWAAARGAPEQPDGEEAPSAQERKKRANAGDTLEPNGEKRAKGS